MILNISVSKEFEHIGEYISTLHNKSRYICELIDRDMKGLNNRLSDEDIQRIVKAVENIRPQQPEPRNIGQGIKLDLTKSQAKETASDRKSVV